LTQTNFVFLVLLVFAFSVAAAAQSASSPPLQISADPFTNVSSQHATEVEAAVYAWGNTIVSVFQQGRYNIGGGASDNGWATSQDGGATWKHGSLPGLTKLGGGGGGFDRVSDPSVTYDAAHGVWLIGSLPLLHSGAPHAPMLVSRSIKGIVWEKPVVVGPQYGLPDKTWLSCDNNPTSPFFGHCYAEWDDNSAGDVIYFSVSTDGGRTWGTPVQPAGGPTAFGAQALAQPGGTVIAPAADAFDLNILSFTSTDGGASWSSPVTVASIISHAANGGLRDFALPTSAMDAAGNVFVFWQDCRFRAGCNANDLVYSTSSDGTNWSAVTRVPIDQVSSTLDHFLPGAAIDPATSGSSAHIGLAYYYYPQANCTSTTCQLGVGYISSTDGGTTWTRPARLANPMMLSWLPATSLGQMVTDYESLAFVNGKAYPVFAVAKANSGTVFNEAMYTPSTGLEDDVALYSSEGDQPVPNAHSDHPPRTAPLRDNGPEDRF
jgi:hypothetical protein